MDPYLVQCVILCDPELCLELNIIIKIMYIKKYKIHLGYIERNILCKYIDFVLEVLKDILTIFKIY
jgi:hypothetical protein